MASALAKTKYLDFYITGLPIISILDPVPVKSIRLLLRLSCLTTEAIPLNRISV